MKGVGRGGGKCVGVGEVRCGERWEKCVGVWGEVRGDVGRGVGKCVGVWGEMWGSVLRCKGRWGMGKWDERCVERSGKVCWGMGGDEMWGEVWRSVLRCGER